ncbi:hypothetical protein WJX72_001214 [[Myrmecia] bisecta]|uniref:RWP-RK domain-containing protein n=1 Tax=[Myrmecia] bisecta TaxID=41462 RepID=A0AAW1PGB4_9CHLO
MAFHDQVWNNEAGGSLCQVWLPEQSEDGDLILRTKGLPFCVAGVGDLLALFRCISCRFCFGTDVHNPHTLGAPGRVFTTGEPEMSSNVQKYSKEVYLRASEAQQCRVHSTIVIPLFLDRHRSQALGVLEVVQTAEDMQFSEIVNNLGQILEACDLFTSADKFCSKEMSVASDTVKTRYGSPAISQQADSSGSAQADHGICDGISTEGSADDEDGEMDEAGDSYGDGYDMMDDLDGEGTFEGRQRRGKGSGNPGKPGKRLRLEDLQSQFGVGLKEAAQRLGICPTTLKRACRRHGIQRWPRRQLIKLSKAIDQINATNKVAPPLLTSSTAQPGTVLEMNPTPDTRWTALAQLIPGISTSLDGAKHVRPAVDITVGGPEHEKGLLLPQADGTLGTSMPVLLMSAPQELAVGDPNLHAFVSTSYAPGDPPLHFPAQEAQPSLMSDSMASFMQAEASQLMHPVSVMYPPNLSAASSPFMPGPGVGAEHGQLHRAHSYAEHGDRTVHNGRIRGMTHAGSAAADLHLNGMTFVHGQHSGATPAEQGAKKRAQHARGRQAAGDHPEDLDLFGDDFVDTDVLEMLLHDQR